MVISIRDVPQVKDDYQGKESPNGLGITDAYTYQLFAFLKEPLKMLTARDTALFCRVSQTRGAGLCRQMWMALAKCTTLEL